MTKKIPITAPSFDQQEIALVQECLDSGWVTQGPFVSRFEQLFAERHDARFALATTSCTAALHLAGIAIGLQPGDEVIVPAFTWITSAHTAEYSGAKAVFVDVDLATFNIDPAAIEAAITPRTRAIVAVHLFGLAAAMDEINAIAKKHNLAVVEDAACAVGTTYRGRPVGAIGDVGCFSFHPRKVITTGEGGMLTTDRKDIADRLKSLRNHGATGMAPGLDPTKPYAMGTFDQLGYNLRLSDIQAAVGVAQMAKLDALLAERAASALRYDSMLADLSKSGTLALPSRPEPSGHSYQSFVVRVLEGGRDRRNAIMEHLSGVGIQTRPGTHAVHRLGYFRTRYGLRPEQFPNACIAEDTTITLPIFPGMQEEDGARIVAEFKRAL